VRTTITATSPNYAYAAAEQIADFYYVALWVAALNSTNIGIINPRAFFANTPIVLTPAGGNFTAGVVNLVVHYETFRGGWNF
jgi:hypothetical protein